MARFIKTRTITPRFAIIKSISRKTLYGTEKEVTFDYKMQRYKVLIENENLVELKFLVGEILEGDDLLGVTKLLFVLA